jgi:hypothetical protein
MSIERDRITRIDEIRLRATKRWRNISSTGYEVSSDIDFLLSEIDRLKCGDFTEDEFQMLCHNLSEDDKDRFFKGCEEYQRKLFGVSACDSKELNHE